MTTLHKLYTYGYSGKKPADLQAWANHLDAIVADCRFQTNSRAAYWRRGPLMKLLGDRYAHIKHLGNENYKNGGEIKFVSLEQGVREVGRLLVERPVILMCMCSNVETCHRTAAANAIAQALGVEVEHITEPFTGDAPRPTLAWPTQLCLAALLF